MITVSQQYDILAKTPSRMMTAITFSRQNDAGSRVNSTQYWENLELVVVLVSEGKALSFFSTAEASSLQKISYREYNNIMRSSDEFTNYLLASDFLLAVFCPEGIITVVSALR